MKISEGLLSLGAENSKIADESTEDQNKLERMLENQQKMAAKIFGEEVVATSNVDALEKVPSTPKQDNEVASAASDSKVKQMPDVPNLPPMPKAPPTPLRRTPRKNAGGGVKELYTPVAKKNKLSTLFEECD